MQNVIANDTISHEEAMYYLGGMNAQVNPVQWSKPRSILTPIQDSNPGDRI